MDEKEKGEDMSVYSIVSSLLSYVFTTIIYFFIFSVIALIYMDIKKVSQKERKKKAEAAPEEGSQDSFAILKTVKNRKAADAKMKSRYRVSGKGIIVGRGKDCDITVNNMFLSVEHFQIWCDEGVWYIGDMGSKNGTYLNGTRLKKVKALEDGDEIAFGELMFIFGEE